MVERVMEALSGEGRKLEGTLWPRWPYPKFGPTYKFNTTFNESFILILWMYSIVYV